MQKFLLLCVLVISLISNINTINQNQQLQKENKKLKYICNQELKNQENQIKLIKNQINTLNKKRFLTSQDIKSLEKIVEAEASTEQIKGKILVANVVLNRLTQSNKAKSVNDIVLERRQFESVSRGRFFTARPTLETKEAVKKALQKDYSKGATYFMNPEISDKDNVKWFRENLELTVRHKEHSFYK